jgi:Cu2+-exporting ATPase
MKIKVNGMMCGHCEMHVKKALEAIDGIDSVVASHEENLVTITNSKDVDESAIKAAVEEAGYEYAGLEQ